MAQHAQARTRRRPPRRTSETGPPSGRQYSLFAATAAEPQRDARHFRRQAQLCQRLLATLHQPELVEMLDRLNEEFEEKATRIETAKAIARDRP